MNLTRLIRQSLAYHWRVNVAVMLGVAAATAVLTGALIVGDSVRGSLRTLTLDRLGKIDELLVLDRFFRAQLVAELQSQPQFKADFEIAAPAILFPQATMERRPGQATVRASSVLVIGCDDSFWSLDNAGNRPRHLPREREIVINQSLADELQAKVGDQVTLRLPKSNQVPADSPLASKNDRIRGLPGWTLVDIVPTEGLGRFGLTATQGLPRNAWVSLSTLQDALDQAGKVNAILLSGRVSPPSDEAHQSLEELLKPSLSDFGVNVKHVKHTYRQADGTEKVAIDYFTITTDRMFFSTQSAAAIDCTVKAAGGQPVLTYLANFIRAIDKSGKPTDHPGVPYSMITAIDPSDSFALADTAGQWIGRLAENEIVLNEWTAADMGVHVGDTIRVSYFEPESTHGEAVERSADFQLKAIAKLTKPIRPYRRSGPAEYNEPLTAANDPDLTPEVKGVTDQETIDDWDAPFPFDYKRVRKVDEKYWDEYRTTPKAFVSSAVGQRLWKSRFGEFTSFRLPNREGITQEQIERDLQSELARHAAELGFQFTPIKARQLAASRGTTPFDGLFLALSFFVIAAALMMVMLLYRLGIERRSVEIGTLLAVGFSRRRVLRLMVAEGSIIAALGGALGIVVALGYARLMIAGLTHWWLDAISTPFLSFHVSGFSLAVGYALGVVTSAATIAWSVWQTRQASVRSLLAGQLSLVQTMGASAADQRGARSAHRLAGVSKFRNWAPLVFLVTAIGLSVSATQLGGMAQAGAFVAGGAALLASLLIGIRNRLRYAATGNIESWTRGGALWRLAVRSATRNPGRSVITVGLMATATFLIVAMSSFRLAPTANGVGGFQLVAESSQPVYVDLNSPARRNELFGRESRRLEGASMFGLRLRSGDDASCQNLYQAAQPRVIGVTPPFVEHFEQQGAVPFTWADTAAVGDQEKNNPWRLLNGSAAPHEAPVPVVIDKNTALYSLHLYRGVGEEFSFTYDGAAIRFRVAGLLENSLLQGNLLIGEADFRQRFPQISGYRFFLIAAHQDRVAAVSALLEDRLGDEGFDATPAANVLTQYLAVQNTYLSTFQSLGALGLLLGTFGLATVQVRNVLERRGELAVLRASGYRRRRLANLVMLENIVLLSAGLATGVCAALLAVLPHKLLGEAAVSWALLRDLAVMLAIILLAGALSSLASVLVVSRLPLLASLRVES